MPCEACDAKQNACGMSMLARCMSCPVHTRLLLIVHHPRLHDVPSVSQFKRVCKCIMSATPLHVQQDTLPHFAAMHDVPPCKGLSAIRDRSVATKLCTCSSASMALDSAQTLVSRCTLWFHLTLIHKPALAMLRNTETLVMLGQTVTLQSCTISIRPGPIRKHQLSPHESTLFHNLFLRPGILSALCASKCAVISELQTVHAGTSVKLQYPTKQALSLFV